MCREEWVGKIYPPKTKEKDFLQHYLQHYNSIELNATHYKVYGEPSIKKWAEKAAGKDFITNEFFRGIGGFEKHLGPIFIQVSDTFSPKRKDELFDYLKTLPTDLQFFLEVHQPDWFSKEDIKMKCLLL